MYIDGLAGQKVLLISDIPQGSFLVPMERFLVSLRPPNEEIAELKKISIIATNDNFFERSDDPMRFEVSLKTGEVTLEWNLNINPEASRVFVTNIPKHSLVLAPYRFPIKFLGLSFNILKALTTQGVKTYSQLVNSNWKENKSLTPEEKLEIEVAIENLKKMALVVEGKEAFDAGDLPQFPVEESKKVSLVEEIIILPQEGGQTAERKKIQSWLAQAEALIDPDPMAEHLTSEGLKPAVDQKRGGER